LFGPATGWCGLLTKRTTDKALPSRVAQCDRGTQAVELHLDVRARLQRLGDASHPVWLGEQPADVPALKSLLTPYPDEMICWPVSARVQLDSATFQPSNTTSTVARNIRSRHVRPEFA
jgi:hypothetical protein